MVKIGLFILSALVLLVSSSAFVSAVDLGDALNTIGTENIVLIVAFIVSFILIFWPLSRFFRKKDSVEEPSKVIPTTIAAALALLITQGINKAGLASKIGGFFFGIGLSEELFEIIIAILGLAGLVFLIIKLKKGIIILLGIFLIMAGLFGGREPSFLMMGIGIALILLYIFLLRKKKKFQEGVYYHDGSADQEDIEDYNKKLKKAKKKERKKMKKLLEKREQEKAEMQKKAEQAQKKAEMMEKRRRSLGELKRMLKYYKFKRNQNIPKVEGESSENYQARKKRRQKKIDNIIDSIKKRIKQAG